jgi:hypothetical protein
VVGGLDKGDVYLPSARASVMAKPIPRPPPVMRTSLPEKSIERGIVVGGRSDLVGKKADERGKLKRCS